MPDFDETRMAWLSVGEGRRLKEEAESLEHQMTHEPINPYCLGCMRAKMTLSPSRKASARGASIGPRPDRFGDQVTADHMLANDEDSVGMDDESCALVMLLGARNISMLPPSPIARQKNVFMYPWSSQVRSTISASYGPIVRRS